MSTTKLFILGPMHFRRGEQPVELNVGKVQALLAYLALSGAPQTREHLIDLLRPESHPDAARNNLRNSLWRLRRTMGEDVVLTEDELVLLSSTQGEVALAEKNFDLAESWFARAIEESHINDNETHASNVRAHLGRAASARGDVDQAEQLLGEALNAIPADGALHLRTQIELWLANVYLERDESDNAETP